MKKKNFLFALCIVLVTFLLTTIFGSWFVERVALIPFVKKYDLIGSRTPLVINTREEVRISDTTDLVAMSNKVKDKLGILVNADGILLASLVSISSDGWYLAPRAVVESLLSKDLRVLTDRSSGGVDAIVVDPATSLAFVKSSATTRAVMPMAIPTDFLPGQRLAAVGLLENLSPYVLGSVLASSEYLPSGEHEAGNPSRVALLQSSSGYIPGQAIINAKADLVGIWTGESMVTASVVQESVSKLLSTGKVERPNLGFTFKASTNSSDNKKVLEVLSVAPQGRAKQAGLQVGDVVLEVSGKTVEASPTPDVLFSGLGINDTVQLKVARGSSELTLDFPAK